MGLSFPAEKPKKTSSVANSNVGQLPAEKPKTNNKMTAQAPGKKGRKNAQNRLQRFERCMAGDVTVDPAGKEHTRIFVKGLDGVKYDKKLTGPQINALWDYLTSTGYFNSASDIFTREGLEACNEVLCRWPRPSEIGRMAVNNGEKIEYYLLRFPVVGEISELVGKQGEYMNDLCEKYDLMYAWVKTTPVTKKSTMWLYARSRRYLMDAFNHDEHLEMFIPKDAKGAILKIDPEITKKMLGDKSDKFVGQ
ncbi:MAG: hypothetical protein B7Z66_15030 [Chromatiales bacterium 21-64-14]|nr:MAG: hypothetical protein B7Z66_15030 [Chromatiales bacterium 21-64-14]